MKKWAGLDGFFCRALLTQFPGPSVHRCPLPCVASWAPLALTDGQDQISFQRRSLAHTVSIHSIIVPHPGALRAEVGR